MLWLDDEKNLNELTSNRQTILIGKNTEEEKYNIDCFFYISGIKLKKDIKGITGNIIKIIFNNKNILIINIDIEYFKKNKITLEQIDKEIKRFQKSCPSKYNNLDTYIRFVTILINIDSSYDLFLNELKIKMDSINFKEFHNNLEMSMKDNLNINANNLAKQLFKFISSKDFVSNLYSYINSWKEGFYHWNGFGGLFNYMNSMNSMNNMNNMNSMNYMNSMNSHTYFFYQFFSGFIEIYEYKKKYLSIEVFWYLLEEMKNMKFDIHIEELIIQVFKEKKFYYLLYNPDPNLEFGEYMEKYNINNESYFLYFLCVAAFILTFKNIFSKVMETYNNSCLLNIVFNNFHKVFNTDYLRYEYDDIIYFFIDNLIKINYSSNHIKNVSQNILFILFLSRPKEISFRDKIDENFFDNYGDTFYINNKIILALYKKDYKCKSNEKYIKMFLEGRKTEKDKFNFDLLVYKYSDMDGEIYKSEFFNEDVLIINIDIEYFKKKKISLEEIENWIEN